MEILNATLMEVLPAANPFSPASDGLEGDWLTEFSLATVSTCSPQEIAMHDLQGSDFTSSLAAPKLKQGHYPRRWNTLSRLPSCPWVALSKLA
jgi:hypothetical protein